MKKLLALLCVAAISLSCVPVLAEDTGTPWVDPDPVEAFIDELDVTGSTNAEKRADFLNPESATYVSQRDAMSGNAYEFYTGDALGTTLRRPHGYQTEATYIRYRVNPGWRLAVKTMDCSSSIDIEIKFRGTHYKTEYRELASTKVVSPTKITEGTTSYEIATHYCDIPADVYWVEVCLPMGNGQWHPNYTAGGTWVAGIMSVSMWDNEFKDELDTPSHVVKVDGVETGTPYGFLNSKAAGYMPQRYGWDSNRIQSASSTDSNIGTYYQHAYYGGTAYLTYIVKGGSVAEVTYCVNNTVVNNYENTPLDYVELATKAASGEYTYNTTYSDDAKTKPVNPASYLTSGSWQIFKERIFIPEDACFLKVELPDWNETNPPYTNWHIGIMSVEVRDDDFYDDIEGSFSTAAGDDGYIIQRAGKNDKIEYAYDYGNDIGGYLRHIYGWRANTGYVAYKAWPGKQVIFDTYNVNKKYRLSIYTSAELTNTPVTSGTLLTQEAVDVGDGLANGTSTYYHETYTGVIPEGHYYVYAVFPTMDADGDRWLYGLRNVTMRDVPPAPVVEYEHSNPGEMAKIDAATGKLTTSGLVMKNAGDTEKVTVYLASYNGNSLVDIDCHIDNEVAVGEFVQYALEVEPAATYRLFIWKGEIEPIAVYDFSLQ